VGDTAELSRKASGGDVAEFLDSIGDHNPIHHDHEYAATTRFAKPIVPGMWTAGLVSAVLGTTLPGPGCIYISQQITFTKPVFFGDVITARVEVVERVVERNRLRLKTTCVNQDGDLVMEGEALLLPPKTAVAYTERKAAAAAVTHWSAQPAVLAAEAASNWARLSTSMLQVWQPKK
jgi:acyl dehydratase